MRYIDKEKLKILDETVALNYRLTHLYAALLENCPCAITKELMDELCSDGAISKKDAIVALLCEIFALDEKKAEDRRLIRDYIRPSVRLLDAKRYTENPYYKNVKVDGVCDGRWELKMESYPAYRAAICDDMIINSDHTEMPVLGFFDEEFSFLAVLEDGNEWMTLTPVDLDTSEEAIAAARGKVVTFGLGLGYYAYMVSEKENVESITVIEKSPDVIRLFERHVLPFFSHPEKVKIICADAFEYAEREMPKEEYDYAFVDTWRDASDGAPMYKRMKPLEAKSPKTEFSYWIENFLISRIRSERYEKLWEAVEENAPDAPESYEEFVKRLCEEVR